MTFCESRPSDDGVPASTPASPEGKWRVWLPRKLNRLSKAEWRRTHPHRKRKWVRSAA